MKGSFTGILILTLIIAGISCADGKRNEQTIELDSNKGQGKAPWQSVVAFFENDVLIEKPPGLYGHKFNPSWLYNNKCNVSVYNDSKYPSSAKVMYKTFTIIYYTSELRLEPAIEIRCTLSGYIWTGDVKKSIGRLLDGSLNSDIRILFPGYAVASRAPHILCFMSFFPHP